MSTTDRDPLILARTILGALLFAGLAVYFHQVAPPDDRAAFFCLTTAGALILHSGRKRKPPRPGGGASAAPSSLLPPLLFCAAALAYGCSGRLHAELSTDETPSPWDPFGIATDHLSITPQASNPVPSGKAGAYAKNTDGLMRFVGTDTVERVAGEAWILRQSAGAPGDISEAKIWYDTVAKALAYRTDSTTVTVAASGAAPAAHAASHLPGGSDALATGTPSSVGTANAAGSASAFARQDHVHALAAATASAPGSMSAADFVKLRDIAAAVFACTATQTTNGTQTTAGTYTPADGKAVEVVVRVSGRKSDGTQAGGYLLSAAFRRAGGTTTQVGTTTALATHEDDAGWDATLDASGTDVRVRVTGAGATNVDWLCNGSVTVVP